MKFMNIVSIMFKVYPLKHEHFLCLSSIELNEYIKYIHHMHISRNSTKILGLPLIILPTCHDTANTL